MTTRINKGAVTEASHRLTAVLDNLVKFTQLPVRQYGQWVNAWNDQFPRELRESVLYLEKLGYAVGIRSSYTQFRFERGGKFFTSVIQSFFMEHTETPNSAKKNFMILTEKCAGILGVDSREMFTFNENLLAKYFGAEDAAAILDHMENTANLRVEIQNAMTVISDVFGMARAAGQIKRMVPDLLQYLNPSLRDAYAAQTRASTLPFEWAPYPKDKVDKMLLTISKGHLLANMSKPGQERFRCSDIDTLPWGLHA